MKLRISTDLSRLLTRARLWSNASIPEITRRAFRMASHSVVPVMIRETTTYGGTVIDVPELDTPQRVREVLWWYLNQYDIPATPEHITDLREGVDYLIEDGQ